MLWFLKNPRRLWKWLRHAADIQSCQDITNTLHKNCQRKERGVGGSLLLSTSGPRFSVAVNQLSLNLTQWILCQPILHSFPQCVLSIIFLLVSIATMPADSLTGLRTLENVLTARIHWCVFWSYMYFSVQNSFSNSCSFKKHIFLKVCSFHPYTEQCNVVIWIGLERPGFIKFPPSHNIFSHNRWRIV